MFVRLNLAAVVEDEHQMGDVLVAEAIGYLPGIQRQASSPAANYHPVGYLDDPALGMDFSQLRESTTTCPPGRAIRFSPVSA